MALSARKVSNPCLRLYLLSTAQTMLHTPEELQGRVFRFDNTAKMKNKHALRLAFYFTNVLRSIILATSTQTGKLAPCQQDS